MVSLREVKEFMTTNKKRAILAAVLLAVLGASVNYCPWLQKNWDSVKAIVTDLAPVMSEVAPVTSEAH